jgi:3-hydroxybutyryl-CoA dehydratase
MREVLMNGLLFFVAQTYYKNQRKTAKELLIIVNMLKTGDQFRHRFCYSQEDVEQYARVSGDVNPLHIDPEAGRNSMFGRNIMHGFLGASVFTKIFGALWMADGHVYLEQTLKWLRPMFADVEYEAVVTVVEVFPAKNRVRYECAIYDPATGDKTISGEALLLNKKQYVWPEGTVS